MPIHYRLVTVVNGVDIPLVEGESRTFDNGRKPRRFASRRAAITHANKFGLFGAAVVRRVKEITPNQGGVAK